MKPPSTEKQARRAQASRSSPGSGRKALAPAPVPRSPKIWDAWQPIDWAGAVILMAAAALRLIFLDWKPLHHDEGVNGQFLTNLFRTGYYHYDPANFHGPTLYYFGCLTAGINTLFFGKAGLSTVAIRLVPALFGIAIVWLLLELRRELGGVGSLVAAALAASSAAFVYFSRYFIHEILFVFFSLAVVVSVLRYRQTARPRYLMLASLSGAFLGTTKETWVITVAVWLIALPCTWIYLRVHAGISGCLRRTRVGKPQPPATASITPAPHEGPAYGWEQKPERLYGVAALLFVAVWVMFYSSFFTNSPKGLYDSFRTFGYWFKTSESAHVYDWAQYLRWMGQEDWPVLVLGFLGIPLALWKANRFLVFCAFWSMGILAAYSLVGYKTPWCVLNMLLPLILMAGYALQLLYQGMCAILENGLAGVFTALVAAGVIGGSLYQAIDVSFYHYDDDTRAYVYAHTRRDFLSLVDEIESVAAANPAGKDIGIVIMSQEHWPLPWYLRNYTHVGYWGRVIDTSEPVLVVHENQVQEVERTLGSRYRRLSSHELRPGNLLVLYVRGM